MATRSQQRLPPKISGLMPITREDPRLPGSVNSLMSVLGVPSIQTIGDIQILGLGKLGLICSVRCPGEIILATYDFVKAYSRTDIAIVGGFHSPMERQCLGLLLARHIPVILCPARDLSRLRLQPDVETAVAQRRLLVLSGFQGKGRRVTRALAQARNTFVAALADRIFMPYAAPGGQTEALAERISEAGKCLLTFPRQENARLMELGALDIQSAHPLQNGQCSRRPSPSAGALF
jgi:hypothetical protein